MHRTRALATVALLIGIGFAWNAVPLGVVGAVMSVVMWTLGEIASASVLPSIIADLAPAHLRGRYQGILQMAFGMCSLLGPIGGMALLEHTSSQHLTGKKRRSVRNPHRATGGVPPRPAPMCAAQATPAPRSPPVGVGTRLACCVPVRSMIILATLSTACLPPFVFPDGGSTDDGGVQHAAAPTQDFAATPDLVTITDLTSLADLTSPKDLVGAIEAGTFSGSVQPLLTQYGCYGCHMSTPWDGGSTLSSAALVKYLTTTKSSQCPTLPYVTAGNPANSYLYQKVLGSGSCFTKDQMPDNAGDKTVAPDYMTGLKTWITNGAQAN